jgi:hypothetical protein
MEIPMKVSAWSRTAIMLLAAFLGRCSPCLAQKPETSDPIQEFEGTVAKLASATADDCGWENASHPVFSADTTKLENKLFHEADAGIINSLNASTGDPKDAVSRVLESMRDMSEHADRAWPTNRRFHYELLEIDPVFVVNYHIRSRSTWSAFAVPALAAYPEKGKNIKWVRVGEDENRFAEHKSDEGMEVYPLDHGPSRLAGFLAKSSYVSCGDGQTGIEYVGYEWDPAWRGFLGEVIRRKGAVSGEVFPAIGKLQTAGTRITLPYCWWSAIDSSVWASLCSVDTYDVSGDQVRFLGTETNRPDLETVARVIEYAQNRDSRAVLAYSASPSIAKKLVALMPQVVTSAGIDFKAISDNLETVDIENNEHLRFILEKRGGKWVVVRFMLNP